MKFSARREGRKLLPKASEVIQPVESMENPYEELEMLLSPQVRKEFVNNMLEWLGAQAREGDTRHRDFLSHSAIALALLNQVLREPILPHEVEGTLLRLLRSPSVLLKRLPKTSSFHLWELAQAKMNFPQEAHLIQITDAEFQSRVDQLTDKPELLARGPRWSDEEIGEMVTWLAMLRPDKSQILLDVLRDPQITTFFLEEETPIFGNGSQSIAAAARLVDPAYELTPGQKQELIRSYSDIKLDATLGPSLFSLAQLAILLAPSVLLSPTGQIQLSRPEKPLGRPQPMPERML